MDFVIPKEALWVRQVRLADQNNINAFMREKATDNNFRSFTVVGAEGAMILLTYEENINADEDLKK